MVKKVVVANLSGTAGTNLDLRGKIPAPIHSIQGATLLAGHSVNEGGTATYDILAASAVTATKVDDYTITLNVDITTKDALELVYVARTEYHIPT